MFDYLSNQDKNRKQWNALGSNQIIENNDFNFVKKCKKILNKLLNSSDELSTLKEIFGCRFPTSERAAKKYGFSEKEQFIEEKFPIRITNQLKIDCEITQNGFRAGLISEFIQKKVKIKQNRKLKFFIDKINISKPYTIYWKVRNVGPEAVKRDCIRGQINKGIDYINETTNFLWSTFCGMLYN